MQWSKDAPEIVQPASPNRENNHQQTRNKHRGEGCRRALDALGEVKAFSRGRDLLKKLAAKVGFTFSKQGLEVEVSQLTSWTGC